MASLSGEKIYFMLKELTGAKIYEEKKVESIKILQKTNQEEKKAEDYLEDLESKIKLLKKNEKNFKVYEKD